MIINPKSGKALQVNRSECNDRTNIHLWKRNGSGAQIFHYHFATKAIVNVKCNKAVDIDGAKCSNGANIQLSRRNGTDAQRFRFITDGRIESIGCAGKVINIYRGLGDNGANILSWGKHGGDNQRWQITYINGNGDNGGNGDVMDKFDFYPMMDSSGNDIKRSNRGNIKAFATECNADPNCRGFNSNGWLKRVVRRQSEWSKWTNDKTKGFYVKK